MVPDRLAANLLLALIFGPLLCGGLCYAAKPKYTQFIFYIHFATHAICLLTLPFVGDIVFPESIHFFGYPITFTVSTTSITISLLTVTALFLIMLVNVSEDEIVVTRAQAVLIEVALAAGSVAFFSGQFMIRYIALEIVGLMIAISVLHPWESRFGPFIDIFLRLRFGDLCLLVSILFLSVRADTLDIALMIETATELPLGEQVWILTGFLLAVIVKLAVVPLDGWWVRFAQETSSLKSWVGTILMPALGLYLLIRVAPLIHARPVLQFSTAITAVILMGVTYVFNKRKPRDFYQRANSLLGCFTLIFAAFMPYLVLRGYVIVVLGFRIFSVLQPQLPKHVAKWGAYALLVGSNLSALFLSIKDAPSFFGFGWSILTVVFLYWIFQQPLEQEFSYEPVEDESSDINEMTAGWLYQHLEVNFLSQVFTKTTVGFTAASTWLYRHIETGFDRLWVWMGDSLMTVSRTTLQGEDAGQQKAHRRIRIWLNGLAKYEKRRQKVSAHWDLIWIPFILIFLLIFLMVTAG